MLSILIRLLQSVPQEKYSWEGVLVTCFSTSSHSHPAFLFKAPHYSVPPSILSVRGKNGRDNVSHTSVSTLLFGEGGCPCQRSEPVTVLFGSIESCLSPLVSSGCLTTLGLKTLKFYNFYFYPARPDYTTHLFFLSLILT